MSRKIVAVEGQLSPVWDALQEAGYHVVPLTHETLTEAQAVVVQGTDDNFLGMENALTNAPVINAEGMTANDVVREVERRALR